MVDKKLHLEELGMGFFESSESGHDEGGWKGGGRPRGV
jgi:hypothetical protein